MRKYLFLVVLAASAACQRKLDVDFISNFGVNVDSTTHTAGTAVNFSFIGNPNTITFYSGEPGHVYANRNRVSVAGTPTLQFSSALNSGSQAGSLLLLASTDFKGVAVGDTATTITNIQSAAWTDITSRANLATSATAAASGNVDLTDLAAGGKPIFLAFKYIGQAGSIQNKWTITGLTVTNTLKDGSVYTIANLVANNTPVTSNYGGVTTYSPGWVVYTPHNTFGWTVTAGTSLVVAGAATVAAATDNAEAWTIMGALDLRKVTPDIGVAVKSITAVQPAYVYTYAKAGGYAATFVAENATRDKADSAVRTINLTIR